MLSRKGKKRKVYAIRRHNGSLCTQKQPETAAFRALKAADVVQTLMNINEYSCCKKEVIYIYSIPSLFNNSTGRSWLWFATLCVSCILRQNHIQISSGCCSNCIRRGNSLQLGPSSGSIHGVRQRLHSRFMFVLPSVAFIHICTSHVHSD